MFDGGFNNLSSSFSLGRGGYVECRNNHGISWWAANGKQPMICEKCGERLWEKPGLGLTCVSQEAS